MKCWQTVEFWIGVLAGILATLVSVAWSMLVYGRGRDSVTKPELVMKPEDEK